MICGRKKDVFGILPTRFSKSLIFQMFPQFTKEKNDFDRQLQEGRIAASKVCPQALPLSLADFFVHFFPKKRACSQARIYHANRTTAGEVFDFGPYLPDSRLESDISEKKPKLLFLVDSIL